MMRNFAWAVLACAVAAILVLAVIHQPDTDPYLWSETPDQSGGQ